MIRYLAATSLIIALCACGKNSAATDGSDPVQLAKDDIAAFQAMSRSGPGTVDQVGHNAFTEIFGGTTPDAVVSYLNQRIHYLVNPNNLDISPGSFSNEKWLQNPTQGSEVSSKYEIGALNIGAVLWIEGLVNQVPVTMNIDGQNVALTSSRTGIVTFGNGFTSTETLDDGTVVTLPHEFRQAILLHEARHSDCTGGLSDAKIQFLMNVKNADEVDTQFPVFPCGHLHTKCPSGDLAGIRACDNEPWGAYTVGALYALSAEYGASDPMNQAIMKSFFLDQMSRVQVDPTALMNGDLGTPDMSSN